MENQLPMYRSTTTGVTVGVFLNGNPVLPTIVGDSDYRMFARPGDTIQVLFAAPEGGGIHASVVEHHQETTGVTCIPHNGVLDAVDGWAAMLTMNDTGYDVVIRWEFVERKIGRDLKLKLEPFKA